MNAQEYIVSQLNSLKEPGSVKNIPTNNQEMVEAIFLLLMSKKFRKYSIPERNQLLIKTAIEKNVTTNEPITISWPFGGYKLWRLEETPETDWAELFTIMYIAKWLKPICALYSPGVRFTFWVDEVVISRMNNIPQTDLDTYQESFAQLLTFIELWLPTGINFEVFLERSQYENEEAFNTGLALEMENLQRQRSVHPQPLSETAIRSIEMNVRVTPEQARDPLWKEKVDLMHNAYYCLQEKQNRLRPAYTSQNINAFTVFFEPNVIPIGSTKTSIAKFWVGVGALQRRNNSLIETILTPSQLEKTEFNWENVNIPKLEGKNFSKIRVI